MHTIEDPGQQRTNFYYCSNPLIQTLNSTSHLTMSHSEQKTDQPTWITRLLPPYNYIWGRVKEGRKLWYWNISLYTWFQYTQYHIFLPIWVISLKLEDKWGKHWHVWDSVIPFHPKKKFSMLYLHSPQCSSSNHHWEQRRQSSCHSW